MMQSKKVNNVTVVSFNGMDNFDARNAYRIKAELKGLINEEDPQVVLDLNGIDFIDSAGFGTIISGLKSARRFGGSLKLCNANLKVKELMKLMHLESVFEMHSDEDKCVASFA